MFSVCLSSQSHKGNVSASHLWALLHLVCVGAGWFEAGQHLQQVKESGEMGLLEEQQHGNVLLLRRRQTGGRQLDALPLPLPPWSSQRDKHHLWLNTHTWCSDESSVVFNCDQNLLILIYFLRRHEGKKLTCMSLNPSSWRVFSS